MLDILSKFDEIEIKQCDKLTQEERIYCELHEKIYRQAYLAYKEVLIRLKTIFQSQIQEREKAQEAGIIGQYDCSTFEYVSQYSDGGISDIESALHKTTERFINTIVYYFKKKYLVELDGFSNTRYGEQKEPELVTLDYILDKYIFTHLEGMNFKEKAIQEIKEKARLSQEYYKYRKYWNYEVKGKTIKFRVNINNIQPALYFYDNKETEIINCYTFNRIQDFRSYDNGNTDIKFINTAYTLEFAKKYLGYVEMTEEERTEYMAKASNW